MSPLASRLFLFADEWLWVGVCLYLLGRWMRAWRISVSSSLPLVHEALVWRRTFWAVLAAGAVMVYAIGYPMLWRLTGEHPW